MNTLTELYDHQKKAVEKLSKLKVGALYFEMGCGKTRTALELIKIRKNKEKVDKILWLCPCSVKENLRRDLLKHTDDINDILICGIETLSRSVKTNLKLLDFVQNNKTYLVVDESNLVKNPLAKRTINIQKLAEYCQYKLILNGTPIGKNEVDLFAQWYILDWRILGYKSYWSFAANHLEYDDYGNIRRCLNVDYLVKKIAPYTYQVKKSECLDLPEKTYETVYYYLTKEQRMHYCDVADMLFLQVNEFEPHTIFRLFNALQNVLAGFRVSEIECGRKKHLVTKPFFEDPYDNPRIQKLFEITDCLEEKAVIFCEYTYEVETITKLMNERYGEGKAVEFYGKLNLKKRQVNLDKFEKEAQFLVANKACTSYGLNLQFCHYAIFYNNDWDSVTRIQAEDRLHRIGQNKNVHIIDICALNTLDEKILRCLWRKEDLIEDFKNEIEKFKNVKDLLKWTIGENSKKPFDMKNLIEKGADDEWIM